MRARAASIASIPLLLYGCLAPPVVVESPAPRSRITPPPSRPGFVIAAPHGSSDPSTGEIAAELARRTGFGLVVAGGFDYEKRLQDAAQGRVLFYVEVHYNASRASGSRVEIGTAGEDGAFAGRLRTLFELTRDVHLRGHASAPRLEVFVEPADRTFYAAPGSRSHGVLRPAARALHLEVSRVVRADARERYLTILADFLGQAATLPAGR